MPIDDDLNFYNKELISLSSMVEIPYRLQKPDISAKAISPICGSKITVELLLHKNKILDFGYELEACALTKTSTAIIKKNIQGKTQDDISMVEKELKLLLSGEAVELSENWKALKIFLPVIEYKSRHNSILLPFEAIKKAFKTLRAKENK